MMTSRERVVAALEFKEPDVVPVAPVVRASVAKYYGYKYSEVILDPLKFADAQLRGLEEFNYDAVWGPPIDEIAELMGCELTIQEDDPPAFTTHIINTYSDFYNLGSIRVQNSPWLEFKLKVIKHLKERVGSDVAIIAPINSPFMTAGRLRGTSNLYMDMIDNPRFVEDLVEYCLEPCIEAAKIVADAGADALWAPIPTGSANCISRTQYKQFCSPYQLKFFKQLRDLGARVISHTCGKWADRLDLAINELPHMLHVCETDLTSLKNLANNQVGIMGQVKPVTTMMKGTPEEVERECYDNIQKAGPGGGFILSADCGLPRDVPKENLLAMVQAAKKYGVYPLS